MTCCLDIRSCSQRMASSWWLLLQEACERLQLCNGCHVYRFCRYVHSLGKRCQHAYVYCYVNQLPYVLTPAGSCQGQLWMC